MEGKRLVLVPYPFQGHITPMLQLGSILDSKGFSITIVHTKFNSPNPLNHPSFSFLSLSGISDDFDTSSFNMMNVISEINKNCEVSFEGRMLETGEVACVIYDCIMKFADVVANRLKIPTILLRTNSAAFLQSHHVLFKLVEENCIPLSESQMQASIPELYPLRYKDLPVPATGEIPKALLDFQQSYMDIRSSSALIWNTVTTLDDQPLQQLQHHWPVPFFSIGPFHKMAPKVLTSLIEEDNSCLSWLDKQAPNSVIYVSLGSLAVINEKELLEMAQGLAKSGQPFLWVVRPSLVRGLDAFASLTKNFKKTIGERGLVVKWAPQQKVLGHSSVGGFLSHCGWNSTLESLSEGVPMICRPCFADQFANARFIVHVWRVGLELESVMEESVETGVRKLMASEDGEYMRKRAMEMKLEMEKCVSRGGSSCESLDQLVKFIISLSDRK